jgi:predicted PurR-regulated permease PerM
VATPSATKNRDSLLILCALVLVTACLYWARQVLIPVALAVLLSFILTPAVAALQRRRLGRLPSVLLVVILALLLLGGVGYIISRQIETLVANLPNYQENILKKIEGLRSAGEGGFWGRIQSSVANISEQLTAHETEKKEAMEEAREQRRKSREGEEPGPPSEEEKERKKESLQQPGATPSNPLHVQMSSSGWTKIGEAVGPAAEGLASSFLVLVLVVFMLIQRENLRNRLVRLVGHGRLIVTTQAFDEGAQRVSRYLIMQVFVNTLFGVALGLGLVIVGIWSGTRELWQYALLWGFLSGTLRFIPYLGTWVGAALITGFSVAILPGWGFPLGIFAFFLAVELLTANVIEPLAFGHSTGISPLALLLAAAFWTWLWGPVGLILSTPLTVILVVLGKYVPELHFFEVLLGDEPALSTDVTYYQRLVARDLDEASDLVEEFAAKHPPEAVYEQVLLPALLHARKDREQNALDPDSYEFVLQGMRETEEDLVSVVAEHAPKDRPAAPRAVALGCPGRDEADELALKMLAQLLQLSGFALEVVSSKQLSAEVLERIERDAPAVVCIGSLPPGGLAQARYLCKRIRQQAPQVKIVVGRWGDGADGERMEARLHAAGADHVATTLHQSRTQIIPLLQVVANSTPAPEPKPPELVTTP